MAESDSNRVFMKVYLQRITNGGTWTTIASDTVNRFGEQIGGEVVDSGVNQIILSFNGVTLDWDETAQYRVMIEKDCTIQGDSVLDGTSEVRVYSVSIA